MTLLTTLLSFVVTLGVLITIHEFGHYWVARRCGVRILRFSIGFGRPLYKTVRGGTEWVLAAIPLGGYVKMLDERDADRPLGPAELPAAFNRQPVGRRALIVLAGPVANLLLAVLVYWGLNLVGTEETRAVVAAPAAQTPAARAGLAEGDAIVTIDGEPAATWNDVRWKLLDKAAAGSVVELEVQGTDGAVRAARLDLGTLDARDVDGRLFERMGLQQGVGPAIVRSLSPDGAAERAGLQVGDRILAIGATPVARASDVAPLVRDAARQPLVLRIERAGGVQDIEVVPAEVQLADGTRVGRMGVGFTERVQVSYGVGEGLVRAVGQVYETSVFSLKTLGRMLVGEASWKNLTGPVTIADYAGQTARAGLVAWLGFLALLSISLGVLNLLPIPMLDGGHLLYYAIETVRGSPPPDRWMEVGQRFGVVVLILLMALALFNDVARLLP